MSVNGDYYDEGNHSTASNSQRFKRNIWSEKKNAALVEIVKNCNYPTPWRPKHGTAKEVWIEITKQMSERPDIFDRPVNWEAAKEHLLLIIERQKMRRSLGDFECKTNAEKYIDEMIKHMLAEDAEKAATALRQKDRPTGGPTVSRSSIDNSNKRKLEHLAPDTLLQLSNAENSIINGSVDILGSNNLIGIGSEDGIHGVNLEREKLRLEFELQKEKLRSERDKERDELLIQRDREFIKFVQDQLTASQTLFQTTNDLLNKLLEKVEQYHINNQPK